MDLPIVTSYIDRSAIHPYTLCFLEYMYFYLILQSEEMRGTQPSESAAYDGDPLLPVTVSDSHGVSVSGLDWHRSTMVLAWA